MQPYCYTIYVNGPYTLTVRDNCSCRAIGTTVFDQKSKDTGLHSIENTGIVSAFGIKDAISPIEANPIGLAADTA